MPCLQDSVWSGEYHRIAWVIYPACGLALFLFRKDGINQWHAADICFTIFRHLKHLIALFSKIKLNGSEYSQNQGGIANICHYQGNFLFYLGCSGSQMVSNGWANVHTIQLLPSQDIEHFITPQSTLVQSCTEFMVYTSGPRQPLLYFHHYTLDLEFHTNEKNIVPLLLLWFLLLSTVLLPIHSCYCVDLRFVHFIFSAVHQWILTPHFVNPLSCWQGLSGFYHLAILNKASMDTWRQVFV